MTNPQIEVLAAKARQQLEQAFSRRPMPSEMSDSMQLSDAEYAEVMSFANLDWRHVTFAQIQQNPDAVFWFAPETFCYYLPGFLSAGMIAGRTDTNAYDALIGMLDRSPEPAYWDEFFEPRWTRLETSELDAVSAWTRWFQAIEPDAFPDNTLERVQDTLELLKMHNQDAAV